MTEDSTSLMKFPCQFTLKLFGKATPNFELTAVTIVKKHVKNLAVDAVQVKPSNKGNYHALSITFTADSKPQLDALYQELSNCPEILMAL